MSRLTQKNRGYEISYGRDHIYGLFIQVFNLTRNDDNEGIEVNLDEVHHELTRERMIAIAEDYGFIITDDSGFII